MNEAEKIYSALFGRPIPDVLIERYNGAIAELAPSWDKDELSASTEIIKRVNDIEAVEYAARFFNKYPVLRSKLEILIRLNETLPDQRSLYLSKKDNVLYALLILGCSGVRSFWKLVKGIVLLKVVRDA